MEHGFTFINAATASDSGADGMLLHIGRSASQTGHASASGADLALSKP